MRIFKRRRSGGKVIDAVAEIEKHQAQIEGRGLPDLHGSARPAPPGAKAFFFLILLMVMMLLSVMAWRWVTASEDQEAHQPSGGPAPMENIFPKLTLKEAPVAPPSSPPPAPSKKVEPLVPDTANLGELVNSVVVDPVMQRRLSSGLQAKKQGANGSTAPDATGTTAREADSGPMSERLQPMKLTAASAGVLANRDMLITQGTMIDCVQDTRFVSAQAGLITCYAPRDTRSASGRVVLVDAGTKFVGYQQGVLAQGQPRIGVVWSRLETPKGVVIHLDSPGTGSLGETGLDGHIDTHFGARFGGAIMVSLISDFGSWASSRGGNNSDSIRFDSTGDAAQDAVSTVLDNSINIPPTLYRNQGGRIGIYVARDLDFSSVYELRPTAR